MPYILHMNNKDQIKVGDRVDVYYYASSYVETANQIGVTSGLKCLGCGFKLADAMEHPDSYIVTSNLRIPIKNISYVERVE